MSKQIVCTIVSKSYLQYARTLATSLAAHNPDLRLLVLLADRVDRYFDPASEPFDLLRLEDLADQTTIEQMCFYYTAYELCCALRGLLHEYILNQTTAQSWIFLDSDILVCHSLQPIWQQLEQTSILLHPHSTTPAGIQAARPPEIDLLRGGLYNAGFLGLTRSDATTAFIHWWKERLIKFCFSEDTVDQIWLNLVPLYFPNVALLLHPGANLGHWNLHNRTLAKDPQGHITANGEPLLFVHFSGWDMANPANVSKHAPMYAGQEFPLWTELGLRYRTQLLSHGDTTVRQFPYAFNYFQTSEPITPKMRRTYYNLVFQGYPPEGSPFANFAQLELLSRPTATERVKAMINETRKYIPSLAK
jgi:hypothetical protein